jgi:nicotinamidase-related amidase
MKRALLIIDVQNDYFNGERQIKYPQGSFENILKAMDIANEHEVTVIAVQHTPTVPGATRFVKGTPGWELHDKIKEKKYGYLVEKNFPGSFTNTELESILKKLGCDTVVIAGYMTQMCCDTTARQAFHMGYNVEFLSDATGTLAISTYAGSVTAEELHRAILVAQSMRFSTVMTESDWEKRLE